MNRLNLFGIAILLLLIIIGNASAYTIFETEQVIITQFGKIIGDAKTTPGLHFKIPLIQQKVSFDKRWLEWDGDPNQIPTKDKKYVWVDAYARWRISDPIKFFKRLRDEASAHSRLDDIVDGEIRNVIASHNLIDMVRTSSRTFQSGDEVDDGQTDESLFEASVGREKLSRLVLEKALAVVPEYGIELADVQFKRINYIESVQEKVFDRMISERKRIAQRFRSEGQGKASEISGKIERERLTIESEAYRKAEEIKGKADAQAAKIYADAYNTNPDLYDFLKTLESYKTVIDDQTTVVLSTNVQLLKYFRKQD
ncbi:MAG: protease modulator HflC [Deltaproteobacteria bacterium]|nr:protease modulator HflC [Deltaproteobacteria bacterium]